MRGSRRSRVVVALTAIALAGCANAGASKAGDQPPSRVDSIKGTGLHRVTFSAQAAQRLGIKTVPVAAAGTSRSATVIPYAALLYDPNGRTWVYMRTKPRSFQRAAVTVTHIQGERAYLSTGPPVGTAVVSVGAAEVYGTEFFSDHE
jgi:hypothetical protein